MNISNKVLSGLSEVEKAIIDLIALPETEWITYFIEEQIEEDYPDDNIYDVVDGLIDKNILETYRDEDDKFTKEPLLKLNDDLV